MENHIRQIMSGKEKEETSLTEQVINETGHDDVISMKTKTATAMKAIQTMAKELDKLNDEDPLPTWWTNKVAMAVSNLDNMADYLDAKVPDNNDDDDEMEEQKDKPPFDPDPKPTRKDQFGNPIKTKNVAKHLAKKAVKTQMGEETELDENLRKAYNIMKPTKSMDHGIEAIKKHMKVDHNTATSMAKKVMDKVKSGEFKEEVEIEEKTLTPAEKKKREEIAKSIERDNPDMPMDKKMAIATATAKRVAEEKKSFVRSMLESKLKRKS